MITLRHTSLLVSVPLVGGASILCSARDIGINVSVKSYICKNLYTVLHVHGINYSMHWWNLLLVLPAWFENMRRVFSCNESILPACKNQSPCCWNHLQCKTLACPLLEDIMSWSQPNIQHLVTDPEIQGKQTLEFPKGPVIKWFVIQQNKTKANLKNTLKL